MQRKGYGGKRSCFCHNFVSSTSAKLTERKSHNYFLILKLKQLSHHQDGKLGRRRHWKSKTGTSPVVPAKNKILKRVVFSCIFRFITAMASFKDARNLLLESYNDGMVDMMNLFSCMKETSRRIQNFYTKSTKCSTWRRL